MKKTMITSSLALALALTSGFSASVNAALASNAVLNFDPGVVTTSSYGVSSVNSGSYFGMDSSGDGIVDARERTAISALNGLVLGSVQDASGSHSGAPDGTESPGIDNPWMFFANTGMHYSISPTDILADDGAGNVELDFSGWGVTWNGIPRIDLSTGGWEGNANGLAIVTCGADCGNGDRFTLNYSATVPFGDPSGIGGAKYNLYLEGTISSIPVPAAAWLFASGILGLLGVARMRKS